ncbi:DMT family transporter [Nitrosomonas europaea]|uniref:DMT family transporter n=1 Tax=Nitrosomonas europaea TaxID=915 RepID=UPI0007921C8F|nr:DMT family transporter [Nitrosomonas europaea]KXK50095.1 MAG: EamA-like transporter family protein [Nitrosomonas europaea]
MTNTRNENLGYVYGLIAVTAFALTLPAMRAALGALDPVFVALGRGAGAAVLAAVFLWFTRQRLPTREEAKGLIIVAAGAVIGFPLLAAWAMLYVDASHGGVVLGILPLATAVAAALFSSERPSMKFWLFALIGAGLVVGYSLSRAGGTLHPADLALFGSIVCAGVSYAEGARLSKSLGGPQVISWALIFSFPILIIPAIHYAPASLNLPLESWLGFIYLTVISQYLGFFPWYHGLALGGIAKVGQTQLLQPFLTIIASVLLLGEHADLMTWLVATLVVAVVAVGKHAQVKHNDPESATIADTSPHS